MSGPALQVLNAAEVAADIASAKIPAEVLIEAVMEAAEGVQAAANRRAPGPHIEIAPISKRKTRAEVAVGPDSDHW